MGMGINAHLGLAKESSWGTPVAATDWIALVRSTLNRQQEYVSRDELLGNWASPDREQATAFGEGDVEFLCHPNVWGHVLRSMFGPPVTSQAPGSAYTHTFIQIDSRYSGDVHFWPYTFELHRDVNTGTGSGSSRRFTGAIGNQLRLAVQAGPTDPFLRGTATLMSKDVTSVAASAPSFEAYAPFKAWQATVTKDGSTNALMEQLEFAINNNAERVYRLNTSQFPAGMQRNNYQTVELTGRMTFDDEAEYDKYVNNSTGAFDISFVQSDATAISSGIYPRFIITLPTLHYTAYGVDIGGPARLVAQLGAHMRYHAGSTTAVRFQLINDRASY